MNDLKISVCIPSVRASTVRHTIDSIVAQTWQSWELIVIGQGNTADDVRAVVEDVQLTDPRVRFVAVPENGCSRARNAGLAAATGDVIAMTDDDCEADPQWLEVVATAFEDPAIKLVGGALLRPSGPQPRFSACPTCSPREVVYDPAAHPGAPPPGWDWLGANFAIRTELVAQFGVFDPYLGPGARFAVGEDTDYKLRLEEGGVAMLCTPRAIVHHTYGRRVGLKAMYRLSRNYARGNAAVAAKLTLRGDPRGGDWYRGERSDALTSWFRERRPQRLPVGLVRFSHFRATYRACLRDFYVPAGAHNLEPRR